jgi:hypothetical protein
MKIKVSLTSNKEKKTYIMKDEKAVLFINKIESTAKRSLLYPCEITNKDTLMLVEIIKN